jgi:hypothetical protein
MGGDAIPPDSKLLEEVLLSPFNTADPKAREQARFAVQPLFFVLYRTDDAMIARVLSDQTWYKLGESDDEIFRCVLIRRAVADRRIATRFSSGEDDCSKRFRREAGSICRSSAEHAIYTREVRDAIREKRACELEY